MRGVALYASLGGDAADDLIARHAPQVKRIAYHLLARLPASVQVDDLIQAGMLGLLEAARRYDPAQGANFATFAEPRIRGAMLDEIRKGDWTPRSVHRKARDVATAIRTVETATGREARDRDIAEQMGMSLAEYHETLADLRGQKLMSLDETGPDDESEVYRIPAPNGDPSDAATHPTPSTGNTSSRPWRRPSICCRNGRSWCYRSITTKSCISRKSAPCWASANRG